MKTATSRRTPRPSRASATRVFRPSPEGLEPRTVLSTITVTLATDPGGAHAGVSLRDALVAVNAGRATAVSFNIPGPGVKTLEVGSALPVVAKAATIDGTTEPGYAGKPLILLKPANALVQGDGLAISAGGSTVRGLAIVGFPGFGIHLREGGGDKVEANFLGVDATGKAARGNGTGGLWIENSSGNTIGGAAATGNVISGNGGDGIRADKGSGGNTVAYNAVGTDRDGTIALPNANDGVAFIGDNNPAPNRVLNNVIATNFHYGIRVENSTNVVVQGNTVRGNLGRGVAILGSSLVTVGGTAAGLGNRITGNGLRDVDAAGVAVVSGSSAVTVVGNDLTGNGRGMRISGSGVPTAAGQPASIVVANNAISGNATQGILMDNVFGGASRNVQLVGNSISGNGLNGLHVEGVTNLTLGGVGLPGNVAERNGLNGAYFAGSTRVTMIGNTFAANGNDGVLIAAGCTDITLPSGNRVVNNVGWGVEILSTPVPAPSLTANAFSGNRKGNIKKW